jgi:hypothetical protein
MKRIFLLAMLIGMSLFAKAQTLDQFVERFSKVEKAEVVNLDKNTLSMMLSMNSGTQDEETSKKMAKAKDMLSKLKFVNILSLEGSSEADRKAFCEAVETLTIDGLELLVEANEEGEHVKIFANIEENRCKELVVLSASEKDPAMVHVAGDFDLDELKQQGGGLMNLNGVNFP